MVKIFSIIIENRKEIIKYIYKTYVNKSNLLFNIFLKVITWNNEPRGIANDSFSLWILFNNNSNYYFSSKNNYVSEGKIGDNTINVISRMRKSSIYRSLMNITAPEVQDIEKINKVDAGTQTEEKIYANKSIQSSTFTADQLIKTFETNKNQLPIKRSYELRKRNVYYKI